MSRPRGRKPKALALHKLHGTLNVTRHKLRMTAEPEVTGDLVSPPDFLSPTQAEGWRYAVAHAPLGILKKIDRGILFLWVEAEDRHRLAAMTQAKMDQGNALPLLSKGRGDGAPPIMSPYLRIMNQAADIMIRAASELGFSPAARPRLAARTAGGVPSTPESPWARLKVLQGGKA